MTIMRLIAITFFLSIDSPNIYIYIYFMYIYIYMYMYAYIYICIYILGLSKWLKN